MLYWWLRGHAQLCNKIFWMMWPFISIPSTQQQHHKRWCQTSGYPSEEQHSSWSTELGIQQNWRWWGHCSGWCISCLQHQPYHVMTFSLCSVLVTVIRIIISRSVTFHSTWITGAIIKSSKWANHVNSSVNPSFNHPIPHSIHQSTNKKDQSVNQSNNQLINN